MPAEYRYATYPDAKVFDSEGNQIKHLLWGDWVKITGPKSNGCYPVRVRGADGFMNESDLQDDRLLEIVFVDVGQGDGCLVITPEDKKLIIDAGIGDNMYRYLNWRFNFLGGVRTFDAAVITHPDADHYRGFDDLFESSQVKFKRIYHNGIMEQTGKPFGPERTVSGSKYISELLQTKADMEAFIAQPERYGRKLYANLMKDALQSLTSSGDIRMLSASGDPTAPSYLEGFEANKRIKIGILGPVTEPDEHGNPRLRWLREKPAHPRGSYDAGKTKNGHSIILKLIYENVSILLGGDLNASAEAFLINQYTGLEWPPEDANAEKIVVGATRQYFGVDIAKSCHHGSADFTDAFMRAVNPAATVISSGDAESYAHPRSDTLGAIGLNGRGWRPLIFSTELSRSTREDEGELPTELGKVLGKLEMETDAQKKKVLTSQRDDLIAQLAKRNVTSYGAINLRTDGEKVVFAYMLEKPRTGSSRGKKRISRWDIYEMQRVGSGPLIYVPDSGH
jgi:beta-lactamase superfamily II metal-dependent hydrolase